MPALPFGRLAAFVLATACTGGSTPAKDSGASTETGATTETGSPASFECPLDLGSANNECSECIDEKCSDILPYCEEDEACACMEECLREEGVGGVEDCLELLSLASRPTGFASVEECVAYACPDRDECSTPADWENPDADLECDGLGTGGLGGGSEADCEFDDSLASDPAGDVLQLQSLEGDFCVRLERHGEGAGTLENTQWTLLDARVGPLGEVAHVSGSEDLCWYSSHHNFRDWTHIWTGTRHFDLALKEDGHGGPRRYHLYAFEEGPVDSEECAATADGVRCIEGPILLYPYEP